MKFVWFLSVLLLVGVHSAEVEGDAEAAAEVAVAAAFGDDEQQPPEKFQPPAAHLMPPENPYAMGGLPPGVMPMYYAAPAPAPAPAASRAQRQRVRPRLRQREAVPSDTKSDLRLLTLGIGAAAGAAVAGGGIAASGGSVGATIAGLAAGSALGGAVQMNLNKESTRPHLVKYGGGNPSASWFWPVFFLFVMGTASMSVVVALVYTMKKKKKDAERQPEYKAIVQKYLAEVRAERAS